MADKKAPQGGSIHTGQLLVFLLAAIVISAILLTPDEHRDHFVKTVVKGMIAVIPIALILMFNQTKNAKLSLFDFLKKIIKWILRK